VSTLNDDIFLSDNNKKVKVLNYMSQLPPASTKHQTTKHLDFKMTKSK